MNELYRVNDTSCIFKTNFDMLPMIKPRSSINLYKGNEVDLATFDYHTSCILVTY